MASSGIVEIQMPQMGESVTEGTVLEWHKQEGEFVEEGETLVEVSTDKVDAEVPAPASGTLTKIHALADETVQVGQLLAEMSVGEAPSGDPEQADGGSPTAEAAQRVAGVESAPEQADGRRISPVARRIAAASGVDLSAVTGSGAGGSGSGWATTTRSPVHSRNFPHDPQNVSLSSLWCPHCLQTITRLSPPQHPVLSIV